MQDTSHLSGVYAAAITPLLPGGEPDLDHLPDLLSFLKQRGCHGALMMGTTGEGTSFSPIERQLILRTALAFKVHNPEFRIFAGTGTPSLQETIELTRMAFELGADAVVVLPPYYYRKISDEGLFTWYHRLISSAVPEGMPILGYHFPAVSGVPLSLDLLARLKDAHPDQFMGIKDSSGDPEHASALGKRFGNEMFVFTGSDRLLSLALDNNAAGCITAMANICSPLSRQVWDSHHENAHNITAQQKLSSARKIMDLYPPAPPLIKAMLARMYSFPNWTVCPPLLPMDPGQAEMAARELAIILHE